MRTVYRWSTASSGALVLVVVTSARAQTLPDISSWPTSFQTAAFVGVAIGFIVITVLGRRSKFSLNSTAEEDAELRELRIQLRESKFREELLVRVDQIITKLNIDDRFKELESDTDHQYAELDHRVRELENEAAIRRRRAKPEG
jgi:hypothetical protein